MSQKRTETATERSHLLLATCRAEPNSPDIHNHVPLAAGHYQMYLIERQIDMVPGQTMKQSSYVADDHIHFKSKPHPRLPKGDVILAIHGFNCTQAAGLNTAFNVHNALAAWGLPLAPAVEHPEMGPMAARVIGFTWPSDHGAFNGYTSAKESVARFAAFSLANLITDLRRAEPLRRIHIVAHSMGCFLTLKALNMLAVLRHSPSDEPIMPMVDEVIWLAPDVNADALERSTLTSPRLQAWRQPAQRPPFARLRQAMHRPQTTAEMGQLTNSLEQAIDTNVRDHPLDGYGYATLNIIRRLNIYSSVNDEAMWISPLANHLTEDAGSASGGIRLGLAGPLHPELMMIPDVDAPPYHQRQVNLIDCSVIVHEHGDYFFLPIPQRDIASRLAEAAVRPHLEQLPELSSENIVVTPPPERIVLTAWHQGAPTQFPIGNQTVPTGLFLYALTAQAGENSIPTTAQPDAPTRLPSMSPVGFLWNTPLVVFARLLVFIITKYYRI